MRAPAPLAAALALAGLLATPLALADGAEGLDHDLADAAGDVVARERGAVTGPVARSDLDLLRLRTRADGGELAQRVTLAAPLAEHATLNLHGEFGRDARRALTLTFVNDPGLPLADRASGALGNPPHAPAPVPVTALLEGPEVELRVALAALPELACFAPAAIVGAVEPAPDGAGDRFLEDLVEHDHAPCAAAAPVPALAAFAAAGLAARAARRRG